MSYTNFNTYSHGTLRDMAQAMNSGEVMAASDPWRRAADTLKAIHASLASASGEAAADWEGSTSDAFYSKMTSLANNINNTASYAQDAAETLKHMATAIDEAKRSMPEEPGLWDQVTDAVGDTASAAVGGNDEDTRTAVKDEKKAQAVAVMQTLAMKYRVATPVLKPPVGGRDSGHDIDPPADPTGVAAIGALITGAGLGGVGSAGSSTGGGSSRATSTSPRTSGSVSSSTATPRHSSGSPAPTDSAIKGGTAQQVPKATGPINYGPGTGLDGGVRAPSSTGPAGHAVVGTSGVSGSGNGTQGTVGFGGGVGPGGVGVRTGLGPGTGQGGFGGGSARGGSVFGAGGTGEGGVGGAGRGGTAGRSGAGSARQAGGVVGESTGRGGGKAFTEGGSGLGARGRAQADQGKAAQGHGMPHGEGKRKKDKEKAGRRPDYLVEDEETWVSGGPSNPNVVE